ncbi:uncharacterized protein LOC120499453 isoform X2 [Passer montanus]|uniref:uncharacterized protein LOC120499453 isoform X2 n=1 Tax=Passer montanus TaxID=9160 RepID=UPI0019606A1A|nr:uncharacterized protein LOC120499453 isoform X2 [Passer montanus]
MSELDSSKVPDEFCLAIIHISEPKPALLSWEFTLRVPQKSHPAQGYTHTSELQSTGIPDEFYSAIIYISESKPVLLSWEFTLRVPQKSHPAQGYTHTSELDSSKAPDEFCLAIIHISEPKPALLSWEFTLRVPQKSHPAQGYTHTSELQSRGIPDEFYSAIIHISESKPVLLSWEFTLRVPQKSHPAQGYTHTSELDSSKAPDEFCLAIIHISEPKPALLSWEFTLRVFGTRDLSGSARIGDLRHQENSAPPETSLSSRLHTHLQGKDLSGHNSGSRFLQLNFPNSKFLSLNLPCFPRNSPSECSEPVSSQKSHSAQGCTHTSKGGNPDEFYLAIIHISVPKPALLSQDFTPGVLGRCWSCLSSLYLLFQSHPPKGRRESSL